MAGEGAMAGATISLKNNKALRKVDRNKWKGYTGSNKIPTKELGQMNTAEMEVFKVELKKKKSKKLILNLVIVSVALLITVYILYKINTNF